MLVFQTETLIRSFNLHFPNRPDSVNISLFSTQYFRNFPFQSRLKCSNSLILVLKEIQLSENFRNAFQKNIRQVAEFDLTSWIPKISNEII